MSKQALHWLICCRYAMLGLLQRSLLCHHAHLTPLHMAGSLLSAVWLPRVEVNELLEMASSLCDPQLSFPEEYFYSCFCFAYSWRCLWDECIKWVTAATRSAFWLLCRTFPGLKSPVLNIYFCSFLMALFLVISRTPGVEMLNHSFTKWYIHACIPSHPPAPCFILCLFA